MNHLEKDDFHKINHGTLDKLVVNCVKIANYDQSLFELLDNLFEIRSEKYKEITRLKKINTRKIPNWKEREKSVNTFEMAVMGEINNEIRDIEQMRVGLKEFLGSQILNTIFGATTGHINSLGEFPDLEELIKQIERVSSLDVKMEQLVNVGLDKKRMSEQNKIIKKLQKDLEKLGIKIQKSNEILTIPDQNGVGTQIIQFFSH